MRNKNTSTMNTIIKSNMKNINKTKTETKNSPLRVTISLKLLNQLIKKLHMK